MSGEAFFVDEYAQHLRLCRREAQGQRQRVSYEWDFGDGQTASGPLADHVYLTDGVYPVKLTIHLGSISDSRTHKLAVSRDWPRIENPPLDKVSVQSRIVSGYDVAKMPPDWLPRAGRLAARAGRKYRRDARGRPCAGGARPASDPRQGAGGLAGRNACRRGKG